MSASHRRARADTDTIVAIITPPGRGGIAALRVAGPDSLRLYHKHLHDHEKPSDITAPEPFYLRHRYFVDHDGSTIDEVMAVFMPNGRSYTGRDQFEIFCHGGDTIARTILERLVKSGARPAEPGEFTRIAFLEGRIDLTQAEAVADIIHASGLQAARAAERQLSGDYSARIGTIREELITLLARLEADIDYPDESVPPAETAALLFSLSEITAALKNLKDSYRQGRIFRDGFRVAIAGRPNAGKSSLFNVLLRQERALVSPVPGTTRDYLSEWLDLSGYSVNIVDTAGLRKMGGKIEQEGRKRSTDIIAKSDLVLWLYDGNANGWLDSLRRDIGSLKRENTLLLCTKIDLNRKFAKEIDEISTSAGFPLLPISSKTGRGVDDLVSWIKRRISETLSMSDQPTLITSERHVTKIKTALRELRHAEGAIRVTHSPEIPAFHARQAVVALEEITGRVYTDDVLDKIFSRFCIGK